MAEGRLVVREFVPKDLKRVLAIAETSFPEEMAVFGFVPEAIQQELKFYRLAQWIQALTRRPLLRFYVGEAEGEVVGTTLLEKRGRNWYITAVMVDPTHRRKGYARAIMSQACTDAFSFGAPRVILHVRKDNPAARNLYLSLGFEPFEEVAVLKREGPGAVAEGSLPVGCRMLRVGEFERRLLALSHTCLPPRSAEVYGVPELLPWYMRVLTKVFSHGISERYAVEHEGVWVGVYRFDAELKEKGAALVRVQLVPAHRGQGVEQALFSQALHRTAEVGSPRLITRLHKEEAALLSVCRELGFAPFMELEGMVLPRKGAG